MMSPAPNSPNSADAETTSVGRANGLSRPGLSLPFPLPSELIADLTARMEPGQIEAMAEKGSALIGGQSEVYAFLLAETITRRSAVAASYQAMLEGAIRGGANINTTVMGAFKHLMQDLDRTSKVLLQAIQVGAKFEGYRKKGGGGTSRQEA